MLLVLIGTTFVGHDWNSGSMSNQLLFEPRRARVWAAKGAVVLLIGLVVAGLVLGAYWTGLWWVADHRGLEIADGTMREAYQQALRGALLAAFAGLGGYALTMLFRSTVATLGVLFAVAIAGPLLITMLGFPGHQRLMPQNNVAAVLFEGVRFTDYNRSDCFSETDRGRPTAASWRSPRPAGRGTSADCCCLRACPRCWHSGVATCREPCGAVPPRTPGASCYRRVGSQETVKATTSGEPPPTLLRWTSKGVLLTLIFTRTLSPGLSVKFAAGTTAACGGSTTTW